MYVFMRARVYYILTMSICLNTSIIQFKEKKSYKFKKSELKFKNIFQYFRYSFIFDRFLKFH